MPDSVSKIRLMNKPSTVVIDPATRIHAIPARGMMPSRIEISNIKSGKIPPEVFLFWAGAQPTSAIVPAGAYAKATPLDGVSFTLRA
jgi:hypothetical protein